MKILVTGASGFLGHHLIRSLEQRFEVVACWNTLPVNFERAVSMQLDFTDADQCASVVKSVAPTHLIHAGAMTQTGECDREPLRARKVNVDGTANLLSAFSALRADTTGHPPHFVFLSTDLVFDGRKPGGYYQEAEPSADNAPQPLMEYGRTKLEAERLVTDACARGELSSTVLRSALIYGPPTAARPCFLDWLISGIRNNEGALFRDEYRAPVYVSDLCQVIESACLLRVEGVYNAGGPSRLSRYEFGLQVAEIFGLPAGNVRGSLSAEMTTGAARPADVSMDISKAVRELGYAPKTPHEGLLEIRRQGHYVQQGAPV